MPTNQDPEEDRGAAVRRAKATSWQVGPVDATKHIFFISSHLTSFCDKLSGVAFLLLLHVHKTCIERYGEGGIAFREEQAVDRFATLKKISQSVTKLYDLSIYAGSICATMCVCSKMLTFLLCAKSKAFTKTLGRRYYAIYRAQYNPSIPWSTVVMSLMQ